MRLLSVLLSLSVLGVSGGYKFLVYLPMFGKSHITFLGHLADILVEEGHEVTALVPLTDSRMPCCGTKKAKIVRIPQSKGAQELERDLTADKGELKNLWVDHGALGFIKMLSRMTVGFVDQCNYTLDQTDIMRQLREEKFDAAFGEVMDSCGHVIFHHLDIENIAFTWSIATFEMRYEITGMPYIPSYVPGSFASYSDRMTFLERFYSLMAIIFSRTIVTQITSSVYDKMLQEKFPGIPCTEELYARTSLVFLNADPNVDFPRPTSNKVIEIGGITVSDQHKPINETWDSLLSLRPKTVLVSFGTMALSYLMPDEYKHTLRETFRRFPETTFIWKYEKPEDDIGKGIDNIIPVTWVPQRDILYDRRLSLFITHCGQGSTVEAQVAGIPLIVIPIMGDQQRNAQVVKRSGQGLVLDKFDLRTVGPLEDAIREVLGNDKYRKAAERVASMIKYRPFSMRDQFVRNMEFLARFGPLHHLDHYGRHLSFIQFYSLDVIGVILFVASIVVYIVYLVLKTVTKRILSIGKAKVE